MVSIRATAVLASTAIHNLFFSIIDFEHHDIIKTSKYRTSSPLCL